MGFVPPKKISLRGPGYFVAFLLWNDEESFGLRVIKSYEGIMRGMVP